MDKAQQKAAQEWLKNHTRYVYCIQSSAKGKPYKIGRTRHPEQRIKNLYHDQNGSGWREKADLKFIFLIPVAYPQDIELEDEIHGLLNRTRAISGQATEWFLGAAWRYLHKIKREKYIADWAELDAFLATQAEAA